MTGPERSRGPRVLPQQGSCAASWWQRAAPRPGSCESGAPSPRIARQPPRVIADKAHSACAGGSDGCWPSTRPDERWGRNRARTGGVSSRRRCSHRSPPPSRSDASCARVAKVMDVHRHEPGDRRASHARRIPVSTRDPRSQSSRRSPVMRALPGATWVTTGYQRDA